MNDAVDTKEQTARACNPHSLFPLLESLLLPVAWFSYAMRFSKPAAPRASTPPEEHNAEPNMDAGILAFGTSVSVNDDLRRSIQSDIEEIDKNISKIKDEIASEQKIGEELRKTRFHALKEARSQHQVATENLEMLTMHQEILRRLQNTYEVEIAARSSGTKNGGASPKGDADSMDVENNNANLPPTTLTVEKLKEGIREVDAELQSWKESFKATAQLYAEQLAQKKEYENAAAEIRRRIQSDQLEERLKQLTVKIQDAVKDKEAELKRTSALKAHNEAVLKRIELSKKAELELVGLAFRLCLADSSPFGFLLPARSFCSCVNRVFYYYAA